LNLDRLHASYTGIFKFNKEGGKINKMRQLRLFFISLILLVELFIEHVNFHSSALTFCLGDALRCIANNYQACFPREKHSDDLLNNHHIAHFYNGFFLIMIRPEMQLSGGRAH